MVQYFQILALILVVSSVVPAPALGNECSVEQWALLGEGRTAEVRALPPVPAPDRLTRVAIATALGLHIGGIGLLIATEDEKIALIPKPQKSEFRSMEDMERERKFTNPFADLFLPKGNGSAIAKSGKGIGGTSLAEAQQITGVDTNFSALLSEYTAAEISKTLLAEAITALTNFTSTKKLDINLANFILGTEAIAKPELLPLLPTIQEILADRILNARKIVAENSADPLKAAELIMQSESQFVSRYASGHGAIGDFILKGYGNCEANTKWLTAVFLASGLQLPEGFKLGVQAYRNHLFPVIYDGNSGNVRDLVSGSEVPFVEAPIYDPAYILQAYVNGSSKDALPIPTEALMIASRNVEGDKKVRPENANTEGFQVPNGVTFSHITGYVFPGTEAWFLGRAPAYTINGMPGFHIGTRQPATLDAGEMDAFKASDRASRTKTVVEEPPLFKTRVEAVTSNNPQAEDFRYLDMRVSFSERVEPNGENVRIGRIEFKHPRDLEKWNNLVSEDEAKRFLAGMIDRAIGKIASETEFQNYLDVTRDPAKLQQLTDAEVTETIAAANTMTSFGRSWGTNLSLLGFSNEGVIHENPIVREIASRLNRAFTVPANANPLGFLAALNKLTPRGTSNFFRLFEARRLEDFFGLFSEDGEFYGPLIELLKPDSTKVAQFEPKLGYYEGDFMIQFNGLSGGTMYFPGGESGEKQPDVGRSPIQKDTENPTAPEITLSPLVITGLIAGAGRGFGIYVNSVQRRWTSANTANFREYFANDESFLWNFNEIFGGEEFLLDLQVRSAWENFKDPSYVFLYDNEKRKDYFELYGQNNSEGRLAFPREIAEILVPYMRVNKGLPFIEMRATTPPTVFNAEDFKPALHKAQIFCNLITPIGQDYPINTQNEAECERYRNVVVNTLNEYRKNNFGLITNPRMCLTDNREKGGSLKIEFESWHSLEIRKEPTVCESIPKHFSCNVAALKRSFPVESEDMCNEITLMISRIQLDSFVCMINSGDSPLKWSATAQTKEPLSSKNQDQNVVCESFR